jgi:hypothetical protein
MGQEWLSEDINLKRVRPVFLKWRSANSKVPRSESEDNVKKVKLSVLN